jgi:cytoskeletal protein CcmA (bactofilin family)
MWNHSVRNVLFYACTLLALSAMASPVSSAASSVTTTKTNTGNVYFSGDEIRLAEPVVADLFAAGRRISVEHPVGADGALAGATVDIKSDIGADLRVAGGTVSIDGNIGGDLVAAGATVKVAKSSIVSGSSLITGGEVSVDGRLAQETKIYARKILVSGQIAGDTRLYARDIVFGPGARIDGNLIYASANPLSPEQLAQVSGKVVRENTPEGLRSTSRGPQQAAPWFRLFFFLSMLVCGSLLFLVFPNAVTGAAQAIKRFPLRSLLIGLALLFTLPPVAILFMITVVGIPIGLALLALYPLLLFLGYLATAFFIGRTAADTMHQPKEFSFGRQVAFLAAALLMLVIATMIPVLGGLVVFAALVIGIGGWAMWLHQRYRYRDDTARDATGAAIDA